VTARRTRADKAIKLGEADVPHVARSESVPQLVSARTCHNARRSVLTMKSGPFLLMTRPRTSTEIDNALEALTPLRRLGRFGLLDDVSFSL
jgi:hypothetical protein